MEKNTLFNYDQILILCAHVEICVHNDAHVIYVLDVLLIYVLSIGVHGIEIFEIFEMLVEFV